MTSPSRPGADATASPVDQDLRERSRAAVEAFFRALAKARFPEAMAACVPDTVWWLPSGADEDMPIERAARHLLNYVGPERCRGEALIITSEDGEAAVVEQAVLPPGSDAATTVTSVLQMREGLVITGRTYADIAAWPGALPDSAPVDESR